MLEEYFSSSNNNNNNNNLIIENKMFNQSLFKNDNFDLNEKKKENRHLQFNQENQV